MRGNPIIYDGDSRLFIATDEPTELYPEGSECPLHQRQHNSHGWYVCLDIQQVMDAFGPVLFDERMR